MIRDAKQFKTKQGGSFDHYDVKSKTILQTHLKTSRTECFSHSEFTHLGLNTAYCWGRPVFTSANHKHVFTQGLMCPQQACRKPGQQGRPHKSRLSHVFSWPLPLDHQKAHCINAFAPEDKCPSCEQPKTHRNTCVLCKNKLCLGK